MQKSSQNKPFLWRKEFFIFCEAGVVSEGCLIMCDRYPNKVIQPLKALRN